MSTEEGPVFTFSLPGGGGSPPCPRQLRQSYAKQILQHKDSSHIQQTYYQKRTLPGKGRTANVFGLKFFRVRLQSWSKR